MDIKAFIVELGFLPKDGTNGIYRKIYADHGDYAIEVDFTRKRIDYGNDVKYDNTSTQNFSRNENFVVHECVDRLLKKGYKPCNIVLE